MIHPLWYVCIVVRLFLAYSISKYNKYSKYLRLIVLFIGLGFGYKALTGSNNETQVAKVFWHNTRIIHSVLFLSAYLVTDPKNSTRILVCDVILSIIYRTYLETN
jgi:hypothetical protein